MAEKECAYPHCAYGAYHGAVKVSVDEIKKDLKEFKGDIKGLAGSINDGFKQFGLIMGMVDGMQKAQERAEKNFDEVFERLRKVETEYVPKGTVDAMKKVRTDWLWDILKMLAVAGLAFLAAKLGGA